MSKEQQPKRQTYTVQAKLQVWASVEIEAVSLKDALDSVSDYGPTDFISFIDDNGHIDSSSEITGVYKND